MAADAAPLWHAQAHDEVERQLATSVRHGLDDQEAAARTQKWGANRLQGGRSRSGWQVFAAQFRSALILVLLGAAALAALVGDLKDAIVIVVVVVLNALVGFYQEYRAEQSLGALKQMLAQRTHVRRNGKKVAIDAGELVPGDLVLMEAGDRVPADGRLVLAANLEIDESALTGESQPAAKSGAVLGASELPVADRLNMAHMSTMVTRGRGEMIVTATGMRTQMGHLSRQLAEAREPPSPLQLQLDRLGKRLGAIALSLVGILFVLQLLRGETLTEAILDSIALAVAAMPEGLPAVVTVTLALGMHKLARQQAIVKRLASVETLGCTTVICSDKTGTLTVNQMTVRAAFFAGETLAVSGEGYGAAGEIRQEQGGAPQGELAALLVPLVACNDSRIHEGRAVGDPTEAALIAFAAKGGVDRAAVVAASPRMAEVPFDSAHKFMATFHDAGGQVHLYVKGAPDVLLARCERWLVREGEAALDAAAAERIANAYAALASRGLRGLLVARRSIARAEWDAQADPLRWIEHLTFVGLVGLLDPPRPEARAAIAACRGAGIAVKMITGDHRDTGVAIARELGLQGEAVTGAELDRMSSSELAARIDGIVVFARVAPAHKVKIVQALQAQGHVVAMTGDGVNDAPALKAADIGVAMGVTGTEVAKEAASMVLTDDNFATIVSAVRQGRALYENIVKFVRFQLSTTVGAILTVFCAPLLGLPEPFSAIQILWVALIMDGPPAVSLALDRARFGVMHEPPRPRDEPVLPWSRIARVAAFGLTMAAGTLGVLYLQLRTAGLQAALTMCFTTFVLFQLFNIFNARAEHGTTFTRDLFGNPLLWASLAGVLGLQALAVHWGPAQDIFGTTDLSAAQWLLSTAVASSVLLLEEARKALALLAARFSSRTAQQPRA
jgi:P-type Ca2+ transporter type 2C